MKAKASAAEVDGFRKRTITPLAFVGELLSIAAQAPMLQAVWAKHALDPRLREMVMLAVARSNESRYCSWAHHEWALIEGVATDRLALVERRDTAGFDDRTRLAIAFACERVAARFAPMPNERLLELRQHFTPEDIKAITLVAKAMDVANLGSNTFDAMLSRLEGRPAPHGRVLDEAIMSAAFLCVLPALLVYFSRASKRPISQLLHRMIEYTRKMQAPSAQPAKAPARAARRRGL